MLVFPLVTGGGVACVVWALSRHFFGGGLHPLKAHQKRIEAAVRALRQEEDLPPWARRWVRVTARRLEQAGVAAPPARYLAGVFLGAAGGFAIGAVFLKNIPAAVVIAAVGFLLPDTYLLERITSRRAKMIEQLGTALRIFASEFGDTPQVTTALAVTASRMPAPLGTALKRASRDLSAGKDKDEVLARTMKDLDFEYGRLFVQLLRIAWEDASVRPLFSRLATRVAGLQTLLRRNRVETLYGRVTGIVVNLMIFPMFFAVRHFVPGAARFQVGHPLGRFLVFLCFLSVLIGLLVNRMINEVDV